MRAHRFNGAEYIGQIVGYVVETRKGLYRPYVGRVVDTGDDDQDAVISSIGSQPPQKTVAEALKAFDGERGSGIAHVFPAPIKPNMMGVWLGELVALEAKGASR